MNSALYVPPAKILTAHAFVDGAYLRKEGEGIGVRFPHPGSAIDYILKAVRDMGGYSSTIDSVLKRRTSFYDAAFPVEDERHESSLEMDNYWEFIEQLPDTHLRFGELRGLKSRQKGVDVLLAVDMLVGAVDRVFDVAILVAGDADFIPVINEVRRRGVSAVVGGVTKSTAKQLRAAADRFVPLEGAGSWALNRNAFVPPSATLNGCA
jgi:hypothetical protein